ncbi:Sensor histidine kinase RcsC [compost metagenome]
MRQLNKEKNKLISIISHDFRAPLNNFQGYLNIIKKTDLNEADRDKLQDELSRSTDEAQRLLDNLMSWTIKQMDGASYELSSFNLMNCLGELIEDGKSAATKKGIGFVVQIPMDLIVKANQGLLQLMIRNLINNAIKFTPSEGTITIHAEMVMGYCLLRIADTGKGIEEEDQQNIFTLDIRSSFGTNGEKGIGLGLVLCKEFADIQHIDISFESKKDVGTTFELAIPN